MRLTAYLTFYLFSSVWAQPEVFKWEQPQQLSNRQKRQNGYSPEYKSCGVGHDCSSCGDTFEQCPAPVAVAVFCYEPAKGQKCCPNGQGKACDDGFYCAMDNDRHTWCCPEGLNLQQCAQLHTVPVLESAITVPASQPPSTTSVSVTVTVTIDKIVSITSMPPSSLTKHPNTTATATESIYIAGVERVHQCPFLPVILVVLCTLVVSNLFCVDW